MFPRWLSWMFLLTMGYVIFSASQMTRAPVTPSKPIVPVITAETYPALAETTDVERWKRKLNPDYAAVTNCSIEAKRPSNGLGFKAVVDQSGDGAGAICGQNIHIKLIVWGMDGRTTYQGEFPLALGSRELAAGVDTGLVGITIGEQRSLIIPPYAMTRAKKSNAPAAALKALSTDHVAYISVTRTR